MILITGASGNVGREVVKQALAVGLNIRATFQSAAKAAQAPAGLEGVIVDYAKPETIRPALEGSRKDFSGWTAGSGTASVGSEFHKRGACGWKATHCEAFRSRWPPVGVPERASRFGRKH
jgi:NAD(P)-dependent dehydrogenase (short-subunit alcohol dehydrogenase family)